MTNYEIFEVDGTPMRNTVHMIYDKELDSYRVITLKEWFNIVRGAIIKLESLRSR